MGRRFFHFSYPGPQKQGRPRLHALRDGDAFAELAAALYEQQDNYSELIINHKNVDHPRLRPSDLLVLTTRPPLNDDDFDRKYIPRSGAQLESSILDVIKLYFAVCRRSHTRLAEEMADRLAPEFRNRGEIKFTTYTGAYYKQLRIPYTRRRDEHMWTEPEKVTTTAAFVLLTRLWPDGPSLLNAFGMDGAGTLIWCYLLRTVYPHLLRSPRFVMAEITNAPIPERPATLAFAKGLHVDILLNHPLA